MTKRGWIYVALIVFVTLSVFTAAVVWPNRAPAEWTLFLQLYGVMAFTHGWERADARQLGQRQSPAASLLTVLLVFVGHAVYLWQSRHWRRAVVVWLVYWAGVVVIWIAATFGASAAFGDIPTAD